MGGSWVSEVAAGAGAPHGAGAVHALVGDLEGARRALRAGATVLRLEAAPGGPRLEDAARDMRSLGTPFFVVDDLEAARELGADGIHLDQRLDRWEDADRFGLQVGVSARTTPSIAVAYVEIDWRSLGGTHASDAERLAELARLCVSLPAPVIVAGVGDEFAVRRCRAAGAAGVVVPAGSLAPPARPFEGVPCATGETSPVTVGP
jgi:thiamine monophosphate synthase